MDRAHINKSEIGGPRRDESTSVDAHERAMAFTYHYALTYIAAVLQFHFKRSKKPPDGHIAKLVVLTATISIFSTLTAIAAARLMLLPKPKRKCRKRHKRSKSAVQRIRILKIERRKLRQTKFQSLLNSEIPNSKGDIQTSEIPVSEEASLRYSSKDQTMPKGFTTSFADADFEMLNTQVPFNTDSVFFYL